MRKNDLTIVMYHFVREIVNSRYRNIKGLEYDDFIEQIHYLNKNYKIVRMEDVVDSLNNGTSLPTNAALLTFDDGYADHFNNVFPILKNMNLQGCFYPPVKAIRNKTILNVNRIHYILACAKDVNHLITRMHALMRDQMDQYDLLSPAQYFEKYAVASRFDTKEVIYFKRMLQVVLPRSLREYIAKQLFNEIVDVDEATLSRELYMTEEKIRCMIGSGMHVGAHGADHYWLDSLTREDQMGEITESTNFLRSVGADMSMWTMCYPFGAYNDDTVSILKEKGCQLALTTSVDIADVSESNRFNLQRLDTNDFPRDRNAAVKIPLNRTL